MPSQLTVLLIDFGNIEAAETQSLLIVVGVSNSSLIVVVVMFRMVSRMLSSLKSSLSIMYKVELGDIILAAFAIVSRPEACMPPLQRDCHGSVEAESVN